MARRLAKYHELNAGLGDEQFDPVPSSKQMVYNMVMIMVNIYQAKAKLSEFVEAVASGERVVICKHNQPVAELRAIAAAPTGPRDLTPLYSGATFTSQAFFEPLNAGEIEAWEGTRGILSKAAEGKTRYTSTSKRRPTKARK
jgi:antitoxin (DNA-binding transcriptional repressor) of toxin-antitoxin stability system